MWLVGAMLSAVRLGWKCQRTGGGHCFACVFFWGWQGQRTAGDSPLWGDKNSWPAVCGGAPAAFVDNAGDPCPALYAKAQGTHLASGVGAGHRFSRSRRHLPGGSGTSWSGFRVSARAGSGGQERVVAGGRHTCTRTILWCQRGRLAARGSSWPAGR